MILRAPAEPSGPLSDAWRHCVGTGRIELALRRDSVVDEEHGTACTARQRMGSPRSPGPRRLDVLHEAAEPGPQHLRVPVEDDRTVLDLTPARHEITLVEVAPVVEEAPEWWDERRLLGTGPR
ncbi:hypothetical protein OG426_41220 [Streptomyces canus]|uniref:hypothetical protein n=1 Tax=Streptomyces canus TaxID=58343 RepID=UPI0038666BC7|nr:hypothetical protein OG426_41220 [Streptomyces canus]